MIALFVAQSVKPNHQIFKHILLPYLMIKSKKGFELAISTLVVIILSLVVVAILILVFTGTMQKFLDFLNGYTGNTLDNANKLCQTQCNTQSFNSFCCENKTLAKEKITCQDRRITIKDCEIDCLNKCTNQTS